MESRKFYLAGNWISSGKSMPVVDPWKGEAFAAVDLAGPDHLEKAVTASQQAAALTRKIPAWQRYEILHHVSKRIHERRDELASLIVAEAGKPIRFALGEVDRAALTFSLAADCVRNFKGETLPLDISPATEGRMGIVRQVPVGVVLAISPFNFPLNLVAHKVAPAIAAGNSVLHKPASKTPLSALALAEIISETTYPKAAYSVLPCPGSLGQKLVSDDRIHLLSFTGSPEVGWGLKSSAGRKKITLELGGDAAVIVGATANLEDAAHKCAMGAFVYAGQVCISVQRIIVVKAVYDAFMDKFTEAMRRITVGDPGDMQTVTGPMIDVQNKERILHWIKEAKSMGAVPSGEIRAEGNLIYPLAFTGVNPACTLAQQEAFAPIVLLSQADSFAEAIQQVNTSRYGLQAGIFTDSQAEVRMAFDELEVAGITLNQAPTFRADNMPYGGIKESGFGREGPEYAIREMSEMRLLVL